MSCAVPWRFSNPFCPEGESAHGRGPSVVELLTEVVGLAGKELTTAEQVRDLWTAAEPFTGVAGEAVVEFHLGERRHVDFTARLWPNGATQLLRSAKAPTSTLRFLARWLSSRGALRRVPYVELEQDLVDGIPFQWIGPAIRPGFDRGDGAPTTALEDYGTALAVLEALPDWPPDVSILANLEDFFLSLPPGVTVNMLSSLGARARGPEPGLRLIASGPRWALVDDLLPRVTRPARLNLTRLLAEHYAPRCVGFDLEIDGSGLRPYIALYRAFRNPRREDPEFRVFMDLALSDGLCSRAEHVRLLQLAARGGRRGTTLTFKVAVRDNQPAQMKAYLERLVY